MAGSRREAVGSILKRIQGLLRSGAMKEEDRPIWYDVVKAIPPKPLPPLRSVQKILYPEDFVRVQFHREYQYNSAASLADQSFKSVPEKFVDTYMELHKKQAAPPDELFEKTAQTMKDQGIRLLRHGETPPQKTISSQPPTQMKAESKPTLDMDSLFAEKT